MDKPNRPKPVFNAIQTLGKIVSVFFFGLLVVTVIRYVDDRYKVEAELAIQRDLVGAGFEQHQKLSEYQSRSTQLMGELDRLQSLAIEESQINLVQDRLVAMAKQYRCTLKKASPRGTIVRDYGETPKSDTQGGSPTKSPGDAKELEIHESGLAVSVEGELDNAMELLRAVRGENWIAATNQLVIRRDPNRAGHVEIDLELGFQTLQFKPNRTRTEIGQVPKT